MKADRGKLDARTLRSFARRMRNMQKAPRLFPASPAYWNGRFDGYWMAANVALALARQSKPAPRKRSKVRKSG